jgi:hypothetical protein
MHPCQGNLFISLQMSPAYPDKYANSAFFTSHPRTPVQTFSADRNFSKLWMLMCYRALGLKASSAASSLRRSSTLDPCRHAYMYQQRLVISRSVENQTNTFTTAARTLPTWRVLPSRRRSPLSPKSPSRRISPISHASPLPPGSSFYQHESALIERIALVSTTRTGTHFCATESTSL